MRACQGHPGFDHRHKPATDALCPLCEPILIVIVVAAIALLVLVVSAKPRSRKASGELSARKPLTPREQAMFFRLQSALPEHVILAQVAFSSLLTTRDRPTRSTFYRKVCDFVVCSKAFQVIAIVGIDDASHRGRAGQDARRDALLESAGYRVVRFPQVRISLMCGRR